MRFVRFGGAWVQVDGGGATPFTDADSTDSPNFANSRGTVLTRPGSDNAPSSWTTIIASAASSIGRLVLTAQTGLPFPASFGERVTALFDVAYGASNTIVAQNLLVAAYAGQWETTSIEVACDIPSGEPIKVRYRVSARAVDIDWFASLNVYGPTQGGETVSMGGNTADSGGTIIDPGAVANTKGSWVVMTTSSPIDFNEFELLVGTADGGERSTSDLRWLVDLAIGTGPEVVLVANIPLSNEGPNPQKTNIPISIPSGTRISLRAQCNSVDPEDRVFDAVLVGLG